MPLSPYLLPFKLSERKRERERVLKPRHLSPSCLCHLLTVTYEPCPNACNRPTLPTNPSTYSTTPPQLHSPLASGGERECFCHPIPPRPPPPAYSSWRGGEGAWRNVILPCQGCRRLNGWLNSHAVVYISTDDINLQPHIGSTHTSPFLGQISQVCLDSKLLLHRMLPLFIRIVLNSN